MGYLQYFLILVLSHEPFFSPTEILNGVIKSVRKDGEWKVKVAQSLK